MPLRAMLTSAAIQGILAGRSPMAKPYTSHEIALMAVEIADYAIFELSKDPPDIVETKIIDTPAHPLV
jgi:hypothetical protein